MEWVILFVVSWILFFSLVDWRAIRLNVWTGLVGIITQLSVDTHAITHNLYQINKPVVSFLGSSVFFVLGPVFTIATLLAQFHPERNGFRISNVFVLMLLYSMQEMFLLSRDALRYENWNFIGSITINMGAMIIFSWFTMVVLDKKGGNIK